MTKEIIINVFKIVVKIIIFPFILPIAVLFFLVWVGVLNGYEEWEEIFIKNYLSL